MPLNSVQLYVQGLLDGLQIPGSPDRLDAYITPPTIEDVDRPKAYIWGARTRGGRQTAPRLPKGGFRKLLWTVDVYLTYESTPDAPAIDQEFPIVVDAVLNVLWKTTMPIFIRDPSTGQRSQILAIGESWDLEYPPERVPATLRMLYYSARISGTVEEAVQG